MKYKFNDPIVEAVLWKGQSIDNLPEWLHRCGIRATGLMKEMLYYNLLDDEIHIHAVTVDNECYLVYDGYHVIGMHKTYFEAHYSPLTQE